MKYSVKSYKKLGCFNPVRLASGRIVWTRFLACSDCNNVRTCSCTDVALFNKVNWTNGNMIAFHSVID